MGRFWRYLGLFRWAMLGSGSGSGLVEMAATAATAEGLSNPLVAAMAILSLWA